MSYYLTIKDNRVVINSGDATHDYVVTSVDDFHDYIAAEAKRLGVKVEDMEVMASSSMDFPHEFTDDPDVIALARALRPDGWVTNFLK